MQTLAAGRIFRLLQVHITFRMTFVIFVFIVAYNVAIVLFQIRMNSPVMELSRKSAIKAIGYNNPSHKWRNLKIKMFMQCWHGAGCHMRLGDGCHCVKACRTTRTALFSVGVCIFSVDFVMHVSL